MSSVTYTVHRNPPNFSYSVRVSADPDQKNSAELGFVALDTDPGSFLVTENVKRKLYRTNRVLF